VLGGFALLGGCSTLPHDRLWGADATASPGWSRAAAVARQAATDPRVWVPLLGAATFAIDDWDRQASDWAREHTPVFGSAERAEDWSDDLRAASAYAHYATMLATASGDDWREASANKARGALASAAAVSSTVAITRGMKTTFDRERPYGLGTESFPSGHTSSSAVHATLAARNLAFLPIDDAVRGPLDAGLYAMSLGTSWARIEAGAHYPSDTLFSLALGRFLGVWFNDTFLDPRRPRTWTVVIYPRADLGPL
jgi:membrane-associated phospholipid phosphatase